MTNEITARLKSLSPGVKIYNASDRTQKVSFNSQGYTFEPGQAVEIKDQDMLPKDAYGRIEEDSMTYRDGKHVPARVVPNPSATAGIIAKFILTDGADKGLVLLRGDASDIDEIKAGTRRYVKAFTASAKRIESDWLRKVIEAKNANLPTPSMPQYVEDAQDFLTKHKGGIIESHKRFVCTLDGRSFNTKPEIKKHIVARYATKAAEWESFVNDTAGLADEAEQESRDGFEALEELAVKVSKKSKKDSE